MTYVVRHGGSWESKIMTYDVRHDGQERVVALLLDIFHSSKAGIAHAIASFKWMKITPTFQN